MFGIAFWGGLGFTAFSAYFVRYALQNLKDLESVKSWPQTQGKVLSSDIYGTDYNNYKICYDYEMNDKKYTGNRFALFTIGQECLYLAETIHTPKQRLIDQIKAKRPKPLAFDLHFKDLPLKKGDIVTVYYKPETPEKAVLFPEILGKKHGELFLALFAFATGIALMIGAYTGFIGQ